MQSGKLNKRTGTPLYMAPELFMRYYGVESDQVCSLARPACTESLAARVTHVSVWCRKPGFFVIHVDLESLVLRRHDCDAVGSGNHDVPDAVWPPALLGCSVRPLALRCDVCHPEC